MDISMPVSRRRERGSKNTSAQLKIRGTRVAGPLRMDKSPLVISPQPLTQKVAPFNDHDCLCEVKFDGFHSLADIGDGACRLVSRKGNIYKRLADLARSLALLACEAILDGELICVDHERRR